MVFAPLPDFQIDGLRAYHDQPEVSDRINRGELTGNRTDSITFICEREGSVTIPAIAFQWWDPGSEEMKEEAVPALDLDVAANPAFLDSAESTAVSAWSANTLWQAALRLIAVLMLGWGGWKAVKFLRSRAAARRVQREQGEAWAFRHALQSCRSGDAASAYRAIYVWLSRLGAPGRDLTLVELARMTNRKGLGEEAKHLQSVIVSKELSTWQGKTLAKELEQLRSLIGGPEEPGEDYLLPLNPARH